MNAKKVLPLVIASKKITSLRPIRGEWSEQELTALSRLVDVFPPPIYEIESGLSEDGDPWYVVTEAASERIVVHLCRIEARYTVAWPHDESVKTAKDIDAAVELATRGG